MFSLDDIKDRSVSCKAIGEGLDILFSVLRESNLNQQQIDLVIGAVLCSDLSFTALAMGKKFAKADAGGRM